MGKVGCDIWEKWVVWVEKSNTLIRGERLRLLGEVGLSACDGLFEGVLLSLECAHLRRQPPNIHTLTLSLKKELSNAAFGLCRGGCVRCVGGCVRCLGSGGARCQVTRILLTRLELALQRRHLGVALLNLTPLRGGFHIESFELGIAFAEEGEVVREVSPEALQLLLQLQLLNLHLGASRRLARRNQRQRHLRASRSKEVEK